MIPPATPSMWRNPLVRHLAVILAVKVLLLSILWWFFFRLPQDAKPTLPDIDTHIVGFKVLA